MSSTYSKPTFALGKRAVLSHRLGDKQQMMIYSDNHPNHIDSKITPLPQRQQFCLRDDEILTLADYAIKTEAHYSEQAGNPCPMDMEWAKDGIDNQLYLIQARPETVVSQQPQNLSETYKITTDSQAIASGRAIGQRIASGRIHKVTDKKQLQTFQAGDIFACQHKHTYPGLGIQS